MHAAEKDASLRKRQGISNDVVKNFVGKSRPQKRADRNVAADKARGKKKLPERAVKKPLDRVVKKPKQSEAAAREFRLRNAKL